MHAHDRLALAGLLLTVFGFMGPALMGDRALMTFDIGRWEPWKSTIGVQDDAPSFNADSARFVLPRAQILRRALSEGELPLWDPGSFLGNPFLALWQTQVLYPPNWLFLGFDARRSIGFGVTLHLLIAVAGVFVLLRNWGLGVGAAVVGSFAFTFGGSTMLRMGHPSFVATLCWLPWSLLSIERFFDTGRRIWLVGIGLFGALLILAGQATLVVLSGYLLGAWCIARAWNSRRSRRVGAGALLALLAAGLIAAPQWLPSLELSQRSGRGSRELAELQRTRLPASRLVQILVPESFGAVRHPPEKRLAPSGLAERSSPSFAASVAAYVGSWLPACAVLGLLAGAWIRLRMILLGLIVASLGIATGTAVFSFAHAMLPGFRFSAMNRALPFVGFGVAVLGARGLHGVASGALSRRTIWCVAGAWSLTALSLWAWMRFVVLPDAAAMAITGSSSGAAPAEGLAHSLMAMDRFLCFALLGAAVIFGSRWLTPPRGGDDRRWARRIWWAVAIALLSFELLSFAVPYRVVRPLSRVFPETPALSWLRENAANARIARYLPARSAREDFVEGSALSFFGLREVGGFAPMHPQSLDQLLSEIRWGRLSAWSVGALGDPTSLDSPLFPLLGARWIVGPREAALSGMRPVFSADLTIWEFADALPEAFAVSETVEVEDLEAAMKQLRRPDFDPRRVATVEGVSNDASPSPRTTPPRAEIVERGFNRILVQVESSTPAWLVVLEAWAPGWRIRVDGQPAREAVPTNGIFIGGPIAAGRHLLQFEYRPASFRWGLGLAGLGFALVTALAMFPGVTRDPLTSTTP